jgi:hypothetical protein
MTPLQSPSYRDEGAFFAAFMDRRRIRQGLLKKDRRPVFAFLDRTEEGRIIFVPFSGRGVSMAVESMLA